MASNKTEEVAPPIEGRDFASVFEPNYPRLVKALYLLSGSREDAEDMAQEALTRVYERWEKVRRMDSVVGYLYTTAFNLQRRRFRWKGVLPRLGQPAVSPDPAASVEARTDVATALARLSTPLRQALVLVDWLGMNSSEAAEVLGVRPGSVRARVHRARTALKENLGEGYE